MGVFVALWTTMALGLVVACAGPEVSSPSPTSRPATPEPTFTALVAATAIPTAVMPASTSTATPTPPPTATASPTPSPTATPVVMSSDHFSLIAPAAWRQDGVPQGRDEVARFSLVGGSLSAALYAERGGRFSYYNTEVAARAVQDGRFSRDTGKTLAPATFGTLSGYEMESRRADSPATADYAFVTFAGRDLVYVLVWGSAAALEGNRAAVRQLLGGLAVQPPAPPPTADREYQQSFVNVENHPYALYKGASHTIYLDTVVPLPVSQVLQVYGLAVQTIRSSLGLETLRHPDVYILSQEELIRYHRATGGGKSAFLGGFRDDTGIYIGPPNVASDKLAGTLAHELAHEVVDTMDPRRHIPPWLNEGLAEFVEISMEQAVLQQEPTGVASHKYILRDALERGTLLSRAGLEAWGWASSPDVYVVAQGYAQGWAFTTLFAESYGTDGLSRLVFRLAAGEGLKAAAAAVTGRPFDGLWSAYQARLKELAAQG